MEMMYDETRFMGLMLKTHRNKCNGFCTPKPKQEAIYNQIKSG